LRDDERVGGVQKSADILLRYALKGSVQLAGTRRIENQKAHAQSVGGCLDFSCFSGSIGIARIREQDNRCACRQQFVQHL
jgi:hypothetical protein